MGFPIHYLFSLLFLPIGMYVFLMQVRINDIIINVCMYCFNFQGSTNADYTEFVLGPYI